MLLVTGITGHTGRYFLQELIKHKYDGNIKCVVRKNSVTSMIANSGLKIEEVVGDLNDKEFINTCMKDVDTVFHIVNIRYSLNIIEAAIRNNVKRVILVHTTGIYSKFRIASEEYKIIENKLLEITKNVDIKVTILRPTMIYGDLCDRNMSKFIKMVDKLRVFPVINGGKGLIQPVNARDLGKAYYSVLMMDSDNLKPEYIVSGEKPITMIDTLRLISDNLGKKTVFVNIPLWLGVFFARTLKILTFGVVDYIEKVQRMSEDRSFPYDDALKDFGYNPESFEVGIRREVKQYLCNNK
ncbi:MAG: NAD(P)H-binding protein [Tissierellia bacterium]|nr:NAD(P)H-binding protein [Tissierellia bacterium]